MKKILFLAVLIALFTGAVDAQFIDRILYPCNHNSGTRPFAEVIALPSGDVNLIPCVGNTVNINGSPISTGGITSINGSTVAAQTLVTASVGAGNFVINTNVGTGVTTFFLPDAGPTARGVVTATGQAFAGQKVFNDNITVNSGSGGSQATFNTGITSDFSGSRELDWVGPVNFLTSSGPRGEISYTPGANSFLVSNNICFKFNNTNNSIGGAPDTGICRNAAGVTEFNNGTPGTFRDTVARRSGLGLVPVATLDIVAAANTAGINSIGTAAALQVSGNGADAQAALIVTAAAGQATSDPTANIHGGAGALISLTAGLGGDQTGATSGVTGRGGTGGAYTVASGGGGNGTNTGRGGIGGPLSFTGGTGGTSVTQNGGSGGIANFTSGTGGAGVTGGAGGQLLFTSGSGGNGSTTNGNGANIIILAGAPGSGAGTAGTYGTIRLSAHALSSNASAVAPVIASGFGTGATVAVGSSDDVMRITTGTTPGTGGVITFNTAYANAPVCSANDETTLTVSLTTTPTTTGVAITAVSGVILAGNNIGVICRGF